MRLQGIHYALSVVNVVECEIFCYAILDKIAANYFTPVNYFKARLQGVHYALSM